jgi:hypothetical protein
MVGNDWGATHCVAPKTDTLVYNYNYYQKYHINDVKQG